MRTFPLHLIHDSVEDQENVRPDGYNGRGMYGKTCASVSFDSVPQSFAFFASLGADVAYHVATTEGDTGELESQLKALIGIARADSMAHGIVAYFPGWVFA